MPYDPNYTTISGSFITTASLVVSTSGSAPIGGFKGIYVGVSGSIPIVGDNGIGAVFTAAVAGQILWISGRYVDQGGVVGTITASGLVGLQ